MVLIEYIDEHLGHRKIRQTTKPKIISYLDRKLQRERFHGDHNIVVKC